ncbi:hypothetical protein TrCOL_g1699 [Triparma columacea]|uniref:Cas1p 10 TM acyl transferase domain-containing protein n=1 Tax=Triparma columacea TaxID=722753 RepID=A0A9W7LE81_9STRA|nr:hypothetical protein TrCOL_g1699 [Triparma columacea]
MLLKKLTEFGLILFICYLAENHPPFPHGEKVYDRDFFFLLTALLFAIGYFTLQDNSPNQEQGGKPDSTILNRDQTEEWKGWMQFMFLLYHYYHAEETYNAIRIMITCYVWMTGFGNFSFFYIKSDYSLVRVIQMLWRLNFLVIFLCLSQNNTYILYYICPLHTFFFFMVYFAMRVRSDMNYSKYGLRIKLFCLAMIIFFIWDVPSPIFSSLHSFLTTSPTVGATGGQMWEWYFRTTLDHWSTFLGMIFAANYPVTSLWLRKVEALPPMKEWIIKLSTLLALLCAFVWWVRNPFSEQKLAYNLTNCYFGFIPLITYIFVRNIHPKLRSRSMNLLHTIGKTTLETYLLQHHLWLTSNAKSLLVLLPGWPKCNFMFVTIIYFFASRRVYSLTMYIRGMLLPNDLNFCLRSLSAITGAVVLSLFFSTILSSPGAIGSVALVLGILLHFALSNVMKSPWATATAPNVVTAPKSPSTSVKLLPAIVVATIVILSINCFDHYSQNVAASSIAALPPSCKIHAAEGAWVNVDGCSESMKGISYHDAKISSFSQCNSLQSWGWSAQPPSSRCRFVHRSSKDLKKTLAGGRRIVFLGDSVVRETFFSLARLLGYNVPMPYEKHSNIEVEVGTLKLVFYWAPFVSDLKASISSSDLISDVVDVLIVGNGLWDCLHKYDEFDEEGGYKDTLSEVVSLLDGDRRSRGTGVMWLMPSTVNDVNLQTEEKREHMTEEQIAVYRAYQRSILAHESWDLVFDTSLVTSPKAADSYDGVHYPRQVYDVFAQIIIQGFDWALPTRKLNDPIFVPNEPGKMANPALGFFMLFLALVGLFTFDGYMGFALVPSLIVGGPNSHSLWEEAFGELHQKLGIITSPENDHVEMSRMEENEKLVP